jgi:soluble lytic murein transglycosylase-like protein
MSRATIEHLNSENKTKHSTLASVKQNHGPPKPAAKRSRPTTPGTIIFRLAMIVLMLLICGLQLMGLQLISNWHAHEQTIGKHVAVMQAEVSYLRTLVNRNAEEELIGLKILVLRPRVPHHTAREIAAAVYQCAQRYQRDPDLILSIMRIESAFDPTAVSNMGAMGLMQVMPQWIDVLDIQCDLFDPECNVKYGLQILESYEQMYKDLDMALTAYNRGPGPVDYALMRGKDPDNGYAGKIRKVYDRLRAISGTGSNLKVAYTE